MKRLMIPIFFIICLVSSIYASSENIALLEKGGTIGFTGVPYNSTSTVENAFNGDISSQFSYDIVRQSKNINVPVDRIWYGKARIDKIEFKTTGAGCAYEYKFLYWDLSERQWKEIIYINANTDPTPVHQLETPILTNKLRYICMKAGPEGTANFHNVYQIFYYGELLDVNAVPLSPANQKIERLSNTSARLTWSDPGPNNDDVLVMGFRIYRGITPDFEPNQTNCIADETTLNTDDSATQFEFEDKKCTAEKIYYKLISISDFGGESDPVSLSIPQVFYSENIGVINEEDERTGRAEFTGVHYSSAGVWNAFDGISGSPQFSYYSQSDVNKGVPVDRIWNSKVKIGHIRLSTTGSGCAYEYKFFYWDLGEREWKEIVYVNKNTSSRWHYLETPIVTNKMRYICIKAGPTGTASMHGIYQIEYYGEFVDNEPPLPPENPKATRLSDSSARITWSDPGPDSEGEPVIGFRIYKSTIEDFEIDGNTLVADEEEFNTLEGATDFTWDDTECSRIRYYYKIVSVDELGDISATANLFLRGIGSVKGSIEQEVEEERTGALKDVLVELLETQGNKITQTSSDENGEYSFSSVQEGNYTLCFSLEGHFPQTISPILIEPDQESTVGLLVLVADRIPPLSPIEDVNNQPGIEQGVVTIFWGEPGAASDGDLPAWYNVYRSSSEIPLDVRAGEIEALIVEKDIVATDWTDYEIPYTPVFYQVRSFDRAGNPSVIGLSFRIDAILAEIPQPVATNNGITFDRNQNVTLSWHEVEDAVSYDIEISLDEDFKTTLDSFENITGKSIVWSDPAPEGRRFWRIMAKYNNGAKSVFSEPAWFDTIDLGIEDSPQVRLLSVIPSYIPVANGVDEFQIQVGLNEDATVSLTVFDLRGKLVKSILSNELLPRGLHTYPWNGEDANQKNLPNGLYILQLKLNLSGQTMTSVKRIGIFR